MTLHEYMLPEIVPNIPSLDELTHRTLPSSLFVGVDPSADKLLLEEGIYSIRTEGNEVDRLLSKGYKHWRRKYAITEPFTNLEKTYYVDFEDAGYIPREVIFGRDLNVFQYNRRKGDRTSVLARLPNYFEPTRGLGHPPRETKADAFDFRDKIPKVFWRGGISGIHWPNPLNRKNVPLITQKTLQDPRIRNRYSRINAVMSNYNNDFADLKFSGNTIDQFVSAEIRKNEVFTPAVHTNEMMTYKYLLCPAGNDVSSALYWIIKTNSIAFKEETDYETIPDYYLKPWVHYIPVMPGLYDLRDKFNYCESNPSYCEWLIANANEAYATIVYSGEWEKSEATVLERLNEP